MEHIKIRTEKKLDWTKVNLPKLDFTPMFEYWTGAMHIIPSALQNLPHEAYQNNKVLTWMDKQDVAYNSLKNEFKRIFRWKR